MNPIIDYISETELLNKGWTKESIACLLGEPKMINKNFGWNKEKSDFLESNNFMRNFISIDDYLQKKENATLLLEEYQKKMIELSSMVKIPEKSLFFQKNEFIKNENIHDELIITHGKFNTNDLYYLFTDGCLLTIGEEKFSSCAGFICNSSGDIILEFAKKISSNIEEFEHQGINFGLQLCLQNNLNNVLCATDCSGYAKSLSFLKNDILINGITKKGNQIKTAELLKKINASICYVPRKYNSHADNLTKIHTYHYYNLYRKNISILDESNVENNSPVFLQNENLKINDFESFLPTLFTQVFNNQYYNFITDGTKIKCVNINNIKNSNSIEKTQNLTSALEILSLEYSEIAIQQFGLFTALASQRELIKPHLKKYFLPFNNALKSFNIVELTNIDKQKIERSLSDFFNQEVLKQQKTTIKNKL